MLELNMKLKKSLLTLATVFTLAGCVAMSAHIFTKEEALSLHETTCQYNLTQSEADRSKLSKFCDYASNLCREVNTSFYASYRSGELSDLLDCNCKKFKWDFKKYVNETAKKWREGRPGDCRSSSLLLSNKLDELGIEHYEIIVGPSNAKGNLHRVVMYSWCDKWYVADIAYYHMLPELSLTKKEKNELVNFGLQIPLNYYISLFNQKEWKKNLTHILY